MSQECQRYGISRYKTSDCTLDSTCHNLFYQIVTVVELNFTTQRSMRSKLLNNIQLSVVALDHLPRLRDNVHLTDAGYLSAADVLQAAIGPQGQERKLGEEDREDNPSRQAKLWWDFVNVAMWPREH